MEMNVRRAKLMGSILSISFFFIHVLMYNIFLQCGVTPMVRFNVFSILFYPFMTVCILKGWYRLYGFGTYLEVVAHMTLSIIFTGWDNGFQVTLFALSVLAFYAEYVCSTLKTKYFRVLSICIVGMVAYIGSYIYVFFHGHPYNMPVKANYCLTIIWGIVTFIIVIAVMQVFIYIVKESEEKLEHQMSHDKLTTLPNRYYFSNYIEDINNNRGLNGYWIAIADIDDFKQINDTYGHNCGDYVLATVSDIFRNHDEVLCCRWGGEEFIFVSSGRGGQVEGYEFIDDLRKIIENYEFRFNGFSFYVTVTIGMAVYDNDMTIDSWISTADGKLYEGKHNGKNKIVL
ncbi:GGDEF domain-containing protein [Pseudobutyrivibrio sp. MD2005]|uniref:GGDEF domain-containing protein n=1 Tax=Pseudobutyrivibrio sp. MD2005 TaxID=1410616 RepID=UPI000685AF26|nr:GGDEF domain-containing protein [Pseudobutyrivibrio sp. MD2005]